MNAAMEATLRISIILAACLATVLLTSCRTPTGSTPEEKRAAVREMRDDALRSLYADAPGARAVVENSVGYAAFSNIGMKVFVIASGRGYGIAVDRSTGKETFMRMLELGGGVGFGIKDVRTVMAFQTRGAFDNFLEYGLDLGGDADVSLQSGDTGASINASENVLSVTTGDIRIFQITKAGAALAATVMAAKYYPDAEIN
jgi:lipid-binding SYLF domain-containing protein